MEKSIENIWREGFEAEKKLSVPIVSNLYKKKSKLIIRQINSTSKKDNLSLLPIALIFFGLFAFFGETMGGIYGATLIFALFLVNQKMLKNLETLDVKDSTYRYLLDYKHQLKNIIRYSTWLIGIGLPLVTIPAYWFFFRGAGVLSKLEGLEIFSEILVILGLALFLSLLGILCYRLTTEIVYGRLLAKLETTIKDMEELMRA
ncbi:hypothetical protein [Salegentibacter sp. F14]